MSTYSPSLRIQLIPTGDQAGTWGNTTNTNLGTLIESAIAGYISVSIILANQALTAVNGAADQSRNMSIALTTTTGANFAVYAPPAEKTYVIYNASAYTATLYNSTVLGNTTAAGAGTAIPSGKTMTVWSDGTNFKFQNTHMVGSVVGNVTGDLTGNVTGNVTGNINGNLTAAAPTAATAPNGTSTTQIATTAFVTTALQLIYPVGSIYTNASVATNPATLIGFGTWTAFGAGRVLVGINGADASFDTIGETGGSKDSVVVSHTHTANVTDPGHKHTYLNYPTNTNLSLDDIPGHIYGGTTTDTSTSTTGITVSNTATGVSGVNANLQPYVVVYMWQRTA